MKEIELSKGFKVIIDDEDYEELIKYNWQLREPTKDCLIKYCFRTIPREDGQKYANGKTKRTMLQMHRQLLSCPLGYVIDHINGDGLDNRKTNLRVASKSQNQFNRSININNKSGCKGVSKFGKKWRARYQAYGVDTHIGLFNTFEQAKLAYDSVIIEIHREFARLNDIKA